MKLKRIIDFLLVLVGSAILLISYFYLDGQLRWIIITVCGVLLLIVLIVALREKSHVLTYSGAPILHLPPAANVTEVVLLSEQDQPLATWPLYGKVSMVIGRDVGENQVDINLSSSTYASTVDVEHAVLNYTAGTWYVEDIASKNGVSVQAKKDGRRYKLAAFQPCKLVAGDIIYVGLVRLLIRETSKKICLSFRWLWYGSIFILSKG